MYCHLKKILFTVATLSLLMIHQEAQAFMSIGLSGNSSSTNSGLEKEKDTSFSGSLTFDLGSYFRIGYTHRQQWEQKDGYKVYENTTTNTATLEAFEEATYSTIKSVDLTLVLYQGRIVVPFVFGGLAWKAYEVEEFSESRGSRKYNISGESVWNAGGGLAVNLTERFSLKYSKTFSPGRVYYVDPDTREITAAGRITDSYTQVGISYKL